MLLRRSLVSVSLVSAVGVCLLPFGCSSGTTADQGQGGSASGQGGGAQGGSVIANGGQSFGGSSNGGATSGNGGTTSASGGASGTSNGGSANGGAANGGSSNGGSSSGGSSSGGAASASGGASSSSGGTTARGGAVSSGGSTAGAPTCASKLTACGSVCVDLQGSAINCGSCGNVCPTGQNCTAGVCKCPTGQAVCNGTCQDITTNVKSCGSCTNVCATGASCVAGACQCPTPQAACGGTCLDVTKDANNCGTCGTKCSGSTQCLYGACLDPSSVSCGTAAQVGKTCANATFVDVGKYWINNNWWGSSTATGSQCVWRTCQSGDLVGWGTSYNWANSTQGQVTSYASLVVGWHWGWKHTDTGLPVQLNTTKAVNSGWAFTLTGSGIQNVSYDLFAHTLSNPGTNDDPTDEIMIWLYKGGGAGPISDGSTPVNVTLGSAAWQLYKGKNTRWNVFSYVRTQNATTSVLNLMDFMKDLVTRGYISNTKYLTSVQAGTEVFSANGQLDTSGFYCRVQ
ncbi:MAG: hypothetical protein QM756_14690 [Polyangiaceae bacterium]